ncbi:hypothetical protein R1sor_025398 [Riccia sorocarpa]|uniref:Glutathione S-transferase n=1 Tax=Riccia sorocarpa TaxID=122646 RepID=A0ABD3G8J0_9MARC
MLTLLPANIVELAVLLAPGMSYFVAVQSSDHEQRFLLCIHPLVHCFSRRRVNYSIMASKIELYSLATPNGIKVSVALEEMGLEYNAHTIDLFNGGQFKPEFVAVNPNAKIPAITDPNGPDGKPIHLFESGAILIYLAEKTGKFLPADPRLRYETIQWLFFQMAGVGPMFGQFAHFYKYATEKCKDPYPLERYSTEAKRLLGVLEKRLEGRQFLVGEQYTIADMATFPWVRFFETGLNAAEYLGFSNFTNVVAWKDRCMERPATAKGLNVCPLPPGV